MSIRVHLFTIFLILSASVATIAQTAPNFPGNTRIERSSGESQDNGSNDTHRELIKEMELKRVAGDFKEHLGRAKESAQLASELRETFSRQKMLLAADFKKLSRIEKLARQIRNTAGGEENKEELKEPPQQIESALDRLAELSAELQKKVESTPRQVISAAIIKRANAVVELVKHIRSISR